MKEKSKIKLTTHSLVQLNIKWRAWTDKVMVRMLLLKGGIGVEEMFQLILFICSLLNHETIYHQFRSLNLYPSFIKDLSVPFFWD